MHGYALLCCLALAAAVPLATDQLKFADVREKKDVPTTVKNVEGDGQPVVCHTKYCYEVAETILRSRRSTVNPCDNFYEYACGRWEVHNPIPETELQWSQDFLTVDKTFRRIKDLLEEADKPSDSRPVKLVKQFYRSCMDIDAIEKKGVQPIRDMLDATGGWPILMRNDEWTPGKLSWQKIDQLHIPQTGNSALLNLEYEVDDLDPSRNILKINQDVKPPLNGRGNAETLYDPKTIYVHGILKVLQAFAGGDQFRVTDRIKEELALMLSFEHKLQMITQEANHPHKRNKHPGERTTIGELQEWYDSHGANSPTAKINFLEIFQALFQVAGIRIDGSEPVIVQRKIFLQRLSKLLNNTSERVIVNYVQWNMVNKFLLYASANTRDIKFDINLLRYQVTEKQPRWKTCIVNIQLKHAVSYLFVKKYVSDEVIDKAREMVEGLQDELSKRINRSEWIGQEMKNMLTEKQKSVVKLIGYPEWYNNDTAFTELYNGLEIGSDYFQNVLNCNRYEFARMMKEFRRSVDPRKWLDYPMTVNAFYTEKTNAILIPAAELQDPFFTRRLPDAVNYGTIGFILGHELAHSFDTDGIRYNKEGQRVSWNSMLEDYTKRVQCFVKHYSNYDLDFVDEHGTIIRLDGNLTINENMADIAGLEVAFAAYRNVKKKKDQLKLPGLEDVSNDEIFFLSFANFWCSSMKLQYAADTINTDEHSPAKYRVLGTLANTRAFARTYKCPPCSPMNRQKKCSLW